jgi:hypothetical protein
MEAIFEYVISVGAFSLVTAAIKPIAPLHAKRVLGRIDTG